MALSMPMQRDARWHDWRGHCAFHYFARSSIEITRPLNAMRMPLDFTALFS